MTERSHLAACAVVEKIQRLAQHRCCWQTGCACRMSRNAVLAALARLRAAAFAPSCSQLRAAAAFAPSCSQPQRSQPQRSQPCRLEQLPSRCCCSQNVAEVSECQDAPSAVSGQLFFHEDSNSTTGFFGILCSIITLSTVPFSHLQGRLSFMF